MYCRRCGIWIAEDRATCATCGADAPRPAQAPASAETAAVLAPAPPVYAAAYAATYAARARYAGFWRRLVSLVVDSLVFLFPNAIMDALLGSPTRFDGTLTDADRSHMVLAFAIAAVVRWLYGALLESSRWQGTLGQQLLGVRVADVGGRRIGFARALARNLAQLATWLICGLGFLFNLWTPKRQTLHDLVAGCVVLAPGAESAAVPVAPEQAR